MYSGPLKALNGPLDIKGFRQNQYSFAGILLQIYWGIIKLSESFVSVRSHMTTFSPAAPDSREIAFSAFYSLFGYLELTPAETNCWILLPLTLNETLDVLAAGRHL